MVYDTELSTFENTVRDPGASSSDSIHECVEGCKECDHSSSNFATYSQENEHMVINIRATDVTLGLRRIPVGFYVVVRHGGLEWRTENKRPSLKNNAVEWNELIPLPSDLSAIVCFRVYASFEFQPMLGYGELLREQTSTLDQLLDHSANDSSFNFDPMDGDIVSPCSSILVTVIPWNCENSDPALTILDPHFSTRECRDQLGVVTDQGHSALSRYRKYDRKQDLDRSIEQFECALGICPLNHPCRAVVQSNLAVAKFILFRVNQTDTSIDVPLRLYDDALSARPVGHVDRPLTLIQLGIVRFARFEKEQNKADLGQAERFLQEAMGLAPVDSYVRRIAFSMLRLHAELKMTPAHTSAQTIGPSNGDLWTSSTQWLQRYHRSGDEDGLEQAITQMEALIKSAPVRDPRYPLILQNYRAMLIHRFRRLGDPRKIVLSQADVVRLTWLHNFANSLFTRFQRFGMPVDLERAISMQEEAVQITPDGYPDKPLWLNNLGNSFMARFQHFRDPADIERAISRFVDAVRLIPNGHPNKHNFLDLLGDVFIGRYLDLKELGYLDRAISIQVDAVQQTLDGHPDKPRYLSKLGFYSATRFEHLGDLRDLEQAISRFTDAVRIAPDDYPDKHATLSHLSKSLGIRFERLREPRDLEQAILIGLKALELTPDRHPDKLTRLYNLGCSFKESFQRFGKPEDIEQEISKFTDVIQLTPDGHPDKPDQLNTLANSFITRFQHFGQLEDIEQAISMHADAVRLTPEGHPNRPRWLNNLGASLNTRFKRLGELEDLDRAISLQSEAIALTPEEDPDKLLWLNNHGNSFISRFLRFGEPSDLERAISMHADAVKLVPGNDPHKYEWLSNLGASLKTRFDRFGDIGDLERAIAIQTDAVQLIPDGHPNKHAVLSCLGNSLITHFERIGGLEELEQGISMHSNAVELIPDGHPNKPGCLDMLGNSLEARFHRLKELGDLERAVWMKLKAVQLIPSNHQDKHFRMTHLANSFIACYIHFGEIDDLERAISIQSDAIQLVSDDHPLKPVWLKNLGYSFKTRFGHLRGLGDLKQAISLFSNSASHPAGRPTDRLNASLQWIFCARFLGHHTLFHAYSVAVGLLSQLAWTGLSLSHRYRELAQGAGVVREAAAFAVESGYPEVAVEWLEQGRSIVWGELFQLRSSYDELSAVHPDHARRLQNLSNRLEQASLDHEQFFAINHNTQHTATSMDEVADRHRAIAIERDDLLKEIRKLPGFERFLLHKEYSQLRASAQSGPVVILNAAKNRCDALIVLADLENVIHVPLPNFNPERLDAVQTLVESLARGANAIPLGERMGKGTSHGFDSRWEAILAPLWKCVVKPVLDSLAIVTPGKQQLRIFWCPTGPFTFLPIHAAGFYLPDYSSLGNKVFDFVVSSYVPTLGILSSTPEPHASLSSDLRFLAVRQPPSDGLFHLPGVEAELEHIRATTGNSRVARTTLLEPLSGTVKEVLELMKNADWVHFACHGVQDAANPAESGLCLADKLRLKISDMIAISRPRGGLAFLSACQTATGDRKLSDEAIHIAAGMLFAGYGGVVGTMWSISDRLAPEVAQGVYRQLFSNETPDYREAAGALQNTVQRLREGGASFSEWIPFIHVGL